MMRRFLPLFIVIALMALLAVALRLNPRELPSALAGQPAPMFELPHLHESGELVSSAAMKDRVWLLNVWASWCIGCRVEHGVILDLSKDVTVVGLNYKDEPEDARKWLSERGDPYIFSGIDADGATALEWGVYGVPETYVIDGEGIVRYKHVGPLDETALRDNILPLLKRLRGEETP